MKNSILSVVINLGRDQNRLKWFLENAKTADLQVERLDAVDALSPETQTLILQYKAKGSKLSDGEIACILSHRKAWERLVDSSLSYIAIFEDDVLLSNKMGELLSLDLIPKNIDLIKLETLNRNVAVSYKNTAFLGNRKLCRLLTKHYCAAGYVVSSKAAKRLLELTETCTNAVDYILFDDNSPFWKEFEIHQVIPALCIQDKIYAESVQIKPQFTSNIETTATRFKYHKRSFHRLKRSFEKLSRYLKCIARGGNPFRFRIKIPFEK